VDQHSAAYPWNSAALEGEAVLDVRILQGLLDGTSPLGGSTRSHMTVSLSLPGAHRLLHGGTKRVEFARGRTSYYRPCTFTLWRL